MYRNDPTLSPQANSILQVMTDSYAQHLREFERQRRPDKSRQGLVDRFDIAKFFRESQPHYDNRGKVAYRESLTGLELEFAQEVGSVDYNGRAIPYDQLAPRILPWEVVTRDLTAAAIGVTPNAPRSTTDIEMALKPWSITVNAGVEILPLAHPVALLVETVAPTAYWVAEGSSLTVSTPTLTSTQTFGAYTVGATFDYSYLLRLAGADLARYVSGTLMAEVASLFWTRNRAAISG